MLLLAGVISFTTSCHKTVNPTALGTFWFHLHTDIDTNEVGDTAKQYRDASGRHFSLSVAQFYISNVRLHNVDGSTYTIANACILKDIDSEQYVIGQAPAGIYDDVTFAAGLSGSYDSDAPAAFSTTGYIPNTTMWFGGSAGYIDMKLQGFADTTTAQNGTSLVPFSYELDMEAYTNGIGSSPNYQVAMPARGSAAYPVYQLLAGGVTYIHIICDYGKLLSVIDFKTMDSANTNTGLNLATAATIAHNVPNLFRYEE